MVAFSAAVVSSALLLAFAGTVRTQQQQQQQQQPSQETPLAFAVRELSPCPDYPDLPLRGTKFEMRVDHNDGDMYIDSEIVVSETLQDPTTLRVYFYKCITKEEDSCELENKWERKTICDDISKNEMVWTPLLASVEGLDARCPIPPGTYKMKDAPITRAIRERIALRKGHWRIKTMMLKGDRVIGCHRGYGEVKPKRRPKSKDKGGRGARDR